MLLLCGQKTFRNNDAITGFEIINGLRVSGQSTDRIDRVITKIADEGSIIITGKHRGKKYRMTNQGHEQSTRDCQGSACRGRVMTLGVQSRRREKSNERPTNN
jgi:hypothetical protein